MVYPKLQDECHEEKSAQEIQLNKNQDKRKYNTKLLDDNGNFIE